MTALNAARGKIASRYLELRQRGCGDVRFVLSAICPTIHVTACQRVYASSNPEPAFTRAVAGPAVAADGKCASAPVVELLMLVMLPKSLL